MFKSWGETENNAVYKQNAIKLLQSMTVNVDLPRTGHFKEVNDL